MRLMLAYRFLRKISEWTVAGFYSEVYVTGRDNVPQHGPLVLAATHHNEIIDIAALSVTIPHRRRICFWAKSTLFKNPFSGALLRSSGSIPVYRNPNSIGYRHGSSASSGSQTTPQADLFKHTSAALAKGEVVGVFPEGTSYTEPAILQVKEGAAWAAVEYVKAFPAGKGVLIVPAAIVYTDKSQYQSRCVDPSARYGRPMCVNSFLAGVNLEDDESVRAVVKDITGEIRQRLEGMTINAQDWDTFNSARIATELAWGKSLDMSKHVAASQSFVKLFSDHGEEVCGMKRSLVKYLGFLHYTGISNAALDYLYPLTGGIGLSTAPSVPMAAQTAFCQLCRTLLHPGAVAFFPVFFLHLPMYITGWFAAQFFTKHNEEEATAQFKAIFGGLGMGLSYGIVVRMIPKAIVDSGATWLTELCPPSFVAARQRLGLVQRLVETVAVTIVTVRILWGWHNYLVQGNLERWRRLSASVKILMGLLSDGLSDARLEAYTRPPPPAENPFVKRGVVVDRSYPPSVSALVLIRALLAARVDAVDVVWKLDGTRGGERRELPKKESD